MNIAKEYGQRLDMVTDNLRTGASLGKLIASYPSHEFVIDMQEARTLFKHVRELTPKEIELCNSLGGLARQQDDGIDPVHYLSDAPKPAVETKHDTQQKDRADTAGKATRTEGAANAAASEAPATQAAEVVQFPGTGAAGG